MNQLLVMYLDTLKMTQSGVHLQLLNKLIIASTASIIFVDEPEEVPEVSEE